MLCLAVLLVYVQVFFVVQLHDPSTMLTEPTGDPDPLLTCDLMEGRDAFLTLAREKHWEFSSLRRAKYSTLAMLVTLHTQGGDRFLYTCNMCQQPVETRYHCTECEVSLLRKCSIARVTFYSVLEEIQEVCGIACVYKCEVSVPK